MTHTGSILGKCRIGRGITSAFFNYKNTILEQKICGIYFPNPIGLSAGFDKNAQLTQILPSVGFGFVEIGSVTGEPCEGNPKPRLGASLLQMITGMIFQGPQTISTINQGLAELLKRDGFKNIREAVGVDA